MNLVTVIKVVPAGLVGVLMARYAHKRNVGGVIKATSAMGAATATFAVVDFLHRRLGTNDPAPSQQQAELAVNADPAAVPTAQEVMGAVEASAKAVKAVENTRPTTPEEVGSNVIDIQNTSSAPNTSTGIGDGMADAFGSL